VFGALARNSSSDDGSLKENNALCAAQKFKGLWFHQRFNIASACFEVKTTMFL
jgi:hypothetical protein